MNKVTPVFPSVLINKYEFFVQPVTGVEGIS